MFLAGDKFIPEMNLKHPTTHGKYLPTIYIKQTKNKKK